MKKIILCIVVLLVPYIRTQAQTAQDSISGIRENVDYNEIEKVYLQISKTLDSVDGYVIFLDKEGRLCSTDGPLTLSVKKKIVIGRSDSIKPVQVVTEEITYSEQIVFKPEDFKLLTMPSGGMFYALAVNLPPDKVIKGDTVVLEWNNFKTEQKIPDF